ncbi:MAG TPA: hypothetical protein VMD99_03580 [Terriglobales bacterium]|nr:hypothetical protein [Terriglobales bacterium]
MYTGTLIEDLLATVEQVEQKAKQRRVEEELHEIFCMQISIQEGDQIFMGAA